jgi:hypothetical protein
MLLETEKGQYHLKNGLLLNHEYQFIIDELFPKIKNKGSIKKFITDTKKSSN